MNAAKHGEERPRYTDPMDEATAREEELIADALARHRLRRKEEPQATGACLECEAPLEGARRWCDAGCRDMWERRARRGQPEAGE